MKYYSCVYMDDNSKVYQVSDDVDGLNCEALAEPKPNISKDFDSQNDMIESAKTTAHFLMCDYLEINLSEYYALHKVLTHKT